MKLPNLYQEKRLWKKGFKIVIGLDESGRGPLAGPVVAAAVNIKIPKRFGHSDFDRWSLFGTWKLKFGISKIRDSKKLSPSQREKFYKLLTHSQNLKWGIGIVSEKVIDKINILEATKLAMKKAIINLSRKIQSDKKPTIVGKWSKSHDPSSTNCGLTTGQVYEILKSQPINQGSPRTIRAKRGLVRGRGNLVKSAGVDFLILDGNFKLDLNVPQKSIIKGDEKVFSCAAASVIAKVTRDRIMVRLHEKYPKYRFDLHKGYATKLHMTMLKKHGFCEIHRKTFRPIAA